MLFVPVKLVTSGFSAHFFFDSCARGSGGFNRKRFFVFRPGLGSGFMDELGARIEALAEPVLREQGLELVDLEVTRQGRKLWIRFFIDRAAGGGVTVPELGGFNLAISRLLDVEDMISEAYTLEVSSPGLDRRVRRLADFVRFQGRRVHLVAREPIAGRRKFQGRILRADEQGVTVEVDGSEVTVAHGNIAKANLEYAFDDKAR
jgi:ribosome maturation factor RimP